MWQQHFPTRLGGRNVDISSFLHRKIITSFGQVITHFNSFPHMRRIPFFTVAQLEGLRKCSQKSAIPACDSTVYTGFLIRSLWLLNFPYVPVIAFCLEFPKVPMMSWSNSWHFMGKPHQVTCPEDSVHISMSWIVILTPIPPLSWQFLHYSSNTCKHRPCLQERVSIWFIWKHSACAQRGSGQCWIALN